MTAESPDLDEVRRALPGAAARGELIAHFQPQVDLVTGRIVAAEALCRWKHPQLGFIRPDIFIPLAEEDGTILEIGRWMIDEGCRQSVEWLDHGIAVEISVNVSAAQLTTPAFFHYVADTIRTSGAHPRALTMEITESRHIDDAESVTALLEPLLEMGVGVSIDDFGTGFSSVQQLVNLPTTEIKVDQTLVQSSSAASSTLLARAVELGRKHGLRTVAEGVETREQLDLVRGLGFDRAQGFLIGPAVAPAELERQIAGQSD